MKTKGIRNQCGSSVFWSSRKGYYLAIATGIAMIFTPAGITTSQAAISTITAGGTAAYWRSGTSRTYQSVGMSGRYKKMGYGNYWINGTYSVSDLTHQSYSPNYRSGALSFEFCGYFYYNGTSGYVLRTKGYSSLLRGYRYSYPWASGPIRKVGRYMYPTLLCCEYTPTGWWIAARRNISKGLTL